MKRRSSASRTLAKRATRNNAPVGASSKAQQQQRKFKVGAEDDEFNDRLHANLGGSTVHLAGSTVDFGAGSMVDFGASGGADSKRRGVPKSGTRKVLKITSRRVGGTASSRVPSSDSEDSDDAEGQTGGNVDENTVEKDPPSPGSRKMRRKNRMKGGGGSTRGSQNRVHHRQGTPMSSPPASLSGQARELKRGDVHKRGDRGARGDMHRVSSLRSSTSRAPSPCWIFSPTHGTPRARTVE